MAIIKKRILTLVLFIPLISTYQLSALKIPFFNVEVPTKYVAAAGTVVAGYYGIKYGVIPTKYAAGAAAVGAGIYGLYRGAKNYNSLAEIEKKFFIPADKDLVKGNFFNWRFNPQNWNSDKTRGNSSLVEDAFHINNDDDGIIKENLKTKINIALEEKSWTDLFNKCRDEKESLKKALFYLYNCSDIPKQFLMWYEAKSNKSDTDSDTSKNDAKTNINTNDFNGLINKLCENSNAFLQTCEDWENTVNEFYDAFYPEEQANKPKSLSVELLKSNVSTICSAFNRTVLYTPGLRILQWKLFPFASKAEDIFFKLLKTYTRLCALESMAESIYQKILDEEKEKSNPTTTVTVNVGAAGTGNVNDAEESFDDATAPVIGGEDSAEKEEEEKQLRQRNLKRNTSTVPATKAETETAQRRKSARNFGNAAAGVGGRAGLRKTGRNVTI